ncbi:DEAD/DEAH box helicase [Acidithiobacillus caldus]|uniref:DEAD/DEAH box helicase n=1 Tax=Acidithiobacillus caldus TaxID=33059 RepID=UPI001C0750D1|nr:DEAD/DEAH box helicase [Acidithiobacillus caldus]MBU2770123.1 DEAD/DEAH box helicase [Acidithiobacillus caldus]
MAIAPDEMRRQLPKTSTAGLWRGMYSDGRRIGLWTTFHKDTNPFSKEVVKRYGFSWLADKKIWVGPLDNAKTLIRELSGRWPELYPLNAGSAILAKAKALIEPFWAMSVRPRLVERDGIWHFSFPYDTTTISFLKKSRVASWDGQSSAWEFQDDLSLGDITDLLSAAAVPERYLTIVHSGEPIQMPKAVSGWTPYMVYVDRNDIETERGDLQVSGAERAIESSTAPEDEEKQMQKQRRAALIQQAFYQPLLLLPIEDETIENIVVRCSLMPHQNDGIRHFLARTSALNGDDMGLGKTRQTVAAAGHLAGAKVIACPASLKDNWSREIRMVYPDAVPFIFENVLPDEQPEWLIVNYERIPALLKQLVDTDRNWKFTVAAFDEAHYLKEPSALRTKASFDLAAKAERKWLLTATPMLNCPEETWTLLRLSGHPAGDLDLRTFSEHFSKSRNDRLGLGERISEWMIRRTKDEVLTLAGKYRQEPYVSVDSEQMERYTIWMEDNNLTALQKINFARQWLEEMKRGPILEMLNDLQPDAKAIIFCNFEKTVRWFMDAMPEGSAVRLTGKENRKQREAAVHRFQNDPECRWFIGNIKAAGVGLNLTAATYVFFVSRPWTPADQTQAEDRAYRIGQDRRVEIYIPTIPHTIDEDIRELLKSKGEITEDVLAGALRAQERKLTEIDEEE